MIGFRCCREIAVSRKAAPQKDIWCLLVPWTGNFLAFLSFFFFDVDQHPPIPPPRRPIMVDAATSESSTELSKTNKEITVQYPPWPGVQELIPAPSSFALSMRRFRLKKKKKICFRRRRKMPSSSQPTNDGPRAAPPSETRIEMHVGDDHVRRFRHVRPPGDGARNVGQLRAAVSAGRRTQQSAAAGGCVGQQRQAGRLDRQFRRFPNSFLTAMSDHLTTAELTEVFNTAMERSERIVSATCAWMDSIRRLAVRRAASAATG